jgi:hypothetical protein
MLKTKNHKQMARLFVVLAAILWLFLTVISISYALKDGSYFYVPELLLILITSIILLSWSASVHRFPHLSSKIGYLAILISVMNLIALALTGGAAHSIIGVYPGITIQHQGNVSTVVPNVSFYIAYIATAIGIIGGVGIIKIKSGFR